MRPRQRLSAAFVSLVLIGCADTAIDLFPPKGELATDAATENIPTATRDAVSPAQSEGGGSFGCLSDNDCASPDAPRCEAALRRCVECVVDDDCGGRSRSMCNRVTNRCALPCGTTADCSFQDVCDTSQGVCVDCVNNSQCVGPNETLCVQETCVECESDQDCAPGTKCWQTTCVECVTSADCPDGGVCSTRNECR
jgi:Cys-rich repeat protein